MLTTKSAGTLHLPRQMKRYCRNCFHPLPNKAKFCPACGQRDSDGKMRMGAMLRKLWDSTFHLEGKFLRTCWQLFIPGRVTLEFFKGKQERYPHPLRMFAIVMFLFLFMVNNTMKSLNEEENGEDWYSDGEAAVVINEDSITEENPVPTYERWKHQAILNDLQQDYFKLPPTWQTPETHRVVDSLLSNYNRRSGLKGLPGLTDSMPTDTDTTSFGLFGKNQVRISTFDIARYTPDEIISRYKIKEWWMKLFIRQSLKAYKNPEALIHSYIGSLTWTILAQITFMSGIMALLYWRRQRYYVEHFIFLLHYHTGLMLSLLVALIGIELNLWSEWSFLWVFLWATYSAYKALRRYYGQSRGKTILKWVIFGLTYYFGFLLFFALGLIVVFAFY